MIHTSKTYDGEFNIAFHERMLMVKAYRRAKGRGTSAMSMMDVDERTFYRKRLEHSITKEIVRMIKLMEPNEFIDFYALISRKENNHTGALTMPEIIEKL